MPHEITSTDQMLSVREMPWHGLGIIMDEHPTREEAQALVHPWEPIEVPVYRAVPVVHEDGSLDTDYEEIPGQKAIERSDNGDHLGVVNETFGLVTNNEMWDVIEAVGTIGTDIRIETAGSLEGGRKVWALLRLDEPIKVAGDPNGATVAYLAFQNGHDGTTSFRAQAINTRIVCANTSRAGDIEARRNGYEFGFRHSKNIGQRIDDAKAAVSMWRAGVTMWQNAMDELAKVKITPEQQTLFVEQFQPMPPNHLVTDRVRNNVETARGQLRKILASQTCEGVDLTAYGLYQAGIEYAQHVRPVRGQNDRGRMESYFKRSMLTDDGLTKATLSLAREVALA